MNTKKSLEKDTPQHKYHISSKKKDILLGLESHNIVYIWDLLNLKEWKKEISWVNNKDIEEIIVFIRDSAKDLLNKDIEEIKKQKINNILEKFIKEIIKKYWNWLLSSILEIQRIGSKHEKIKEIRKYNKLEETSSIDHLTELLNRKTMDLFIQDAIEERKRNWTNYRLVLIDIDHFKKINDVYWHLTWDNVIIELANIFKEKFRWNDKVARWWWEEFTILMKWWEKKSYLDKIEKLRLFIEETLVKNVTNSTLKIEWNITISAWITCIKETDKQFNEVIQRADTRLYKAKNTRNTVVFKAWVEENKAIKKEAE